MTDTNRTTPALSSATPEGDVIECHRPADMDAETWEQVKAESRAYFAALVEEVRA